MIMFINKQEGKLKIYVRSSVCLYTLAFTDKFSYKQLYPVPEFPDKQLTDDGR